jgi:uncharacterized protein YraI
MSVKHTGLMLAGIAVVLLLAGLRVDVVQAQGGESCPVVLPQHVQALLDRCGAAASGTACVGTSAAVTGVSGEVRNLGGGDQQVLSDVASITTDLVSTEPDMPGIAVLRLSQTAESAALMAVLFGSAELVEVPAPPIAPTCNAVSVGEVNVRAQPNTSATILGQLVLNESAPITARLADSSWWRIIWQGEPAWIFAQLAPADCDTAALLVYDPVTETLSGGVAGAPWQHGQLTTDFTAGLCDNAPAGGLLLQSDVGMANWRINGLGIGVDGTALVQASPQDVLAVQVLDGQVVLEAAGITRIANTGQLLRVPLQDGRLAALPGPALDGLPASAWAAPIAILPRALTPPAVDTQPVAAAQDVDLVCGLLPQQITGGSGDLRVDVPVAGTLRLTAEGAPLTGVAVTRPDGTVEQITPVLGETAISIPTDEGGVTGWC